MFWPKLFTFVYWYSFFFGLGDSWNIWNLQPIKNEYIEMEPKICVRMSNLLYWVKILPCTLRIEKAHASTSYFLMRISFFWGFLICSCSAPTQINCGNLYFVTKALGAENKTFFHLRASSSCWEKLGLWLILGVGPIFWEFDQKIGTWANWPKFWFFPATWKGSKKVKWVTNKIFADFSSTLFCNPQQREYWLLCSCMWVWEKSVTEIEPCCISKSPAFFAVQTICTWIILSENFWHFIDMVSQACMIFWWMKKCLLFSPTDPLGKKEEDFINCFCSNITSLHAWCQRRCSSLFGGRHIHHFH